MSETVDTASNVQCNGVSNGNIYFHGTVCVSKCKRNYYHHGGDMTRTCTHNKWSGTAIDCRGI